MRSKLAIAGFILSLLSILFLLAIIIERDKAKNIDLILGISMGEFTGLFTGYVLLPILFIVSFILSIVSLRRIKKYHLEGKFFAISGLVISLIPFVIILLYILLFRIILLFSN
mgnify:CR=1 FL=1